MKSSVKNNKLYYEMLRIRKEVLTVYGEETTTLELKCVKTLEKY